MGKLVRSLLLAAFMGGLVVAGGIGAAPAQVKDKAKDVKKDAKDTKADKAGGTVEIYEAKDGFRFRVKDADGKVIAQPTKGYEKKEDLVKALDHVKTILTTVKPVEVKK